MNPTPQALTVFDGPAAPSFLGGATDMLVPLLIFGTVWYLFVLRPQSNEKDARDAMLAALSKGDAVVTNGGFLGTIVEIEADILTVELAEKVRVRLERNAVARKQGDAGGKK